MIGQKKRIWLLKRISYLTILWWILAEGSAEQWWFGALVVLVTTVACYAVSSGDLTTIPLRPKALAALVPYFFYQSYKGGISVAWAAFSLRRKLRPHYVRYPMRIGPEQHMARLTFAAVLCLFPGTVSCRYEDNELIMHVLDEGMLNWKEAQVFEGLVAAAFCVGETCFLDR